MKRYYTIAIAALALAFTGCSKDNNNTDTWNGEIRLSSGVTVQQTRAFTSMNTQLPNGQTVAVYVDKATTPVSQIYGNNVLTADGSGGFAGVTTMYFPEDKSAVDIYAFHTNATLSASFPSTAITHAVSADQSSEANYLSSDLLYAARTGVTFTKTAVPLTFYHMLAKVQVAIKSGNGSPELIGAEVFIAGTKLKADFTPDKSVDMTKQSDRDGMITTTGSSNNATDIKISSAATTDFSSPTYNDAVIVPQMLSQNDVFIKVKLASGTVLMHKLSAETTFESGKMYQYHITVNLSGLSVTSTITNWDAVGAVTGNAEME